MTRLGRYARVSESGARSRRAGTGAARLLAGPALLLALSCGGGGGSGPTASTPVAAPTPTPAPSFSLVGQWERFDSSFPELDGMVVQVDGAESQGLIVTTPANRYQFQTGDLKWRNLTRTANGEYRFDDLVRQASTGSQSYIAGVLQAQPQGQELRATFPSSGTVQRWRRR